MKKSELIDRLLKIPGVLILLILMTISIATGPWWLPVGLAIVLSLIITIFDL